MKINKIFLISILLLSVLCIGAVSAAENVTADDVTPTLSTVSDVQLTDGNESGETPSEDTRQEFNASIAADFVANESTDIKISAPDDLTGQFELYADGEFIKNETDLGNESEHNYTREFNNVTIPTPGNHTLTLVHPGDAKYLPLNKTIDIIVKGISSVEIADIPDTFATDNVTVTFNVTNPTNISALITNLDDNTTSEITNITNNTITQRLKAGKYNITIFNSESEYCLSSNATKEFRVIKVGSKVEIDDIKDIIYRQNATVNFTVENQTSINVTLRDKNNNTIDVNVINSTVELNDLEVGEYTLNITNVEDENTTESSASKTFSVVKANSTVDVKNTDHVYGDIINIEITSENATNVTYVLTDSEGNIIKNATLGASGNITDLVLDAGVYTLNVTTITDDAYQNVTATFNITVKKADASILTVSDQGTKTIGEEITIPVMVVNEAINPSGTLVFKIGNETVEEVNFTNSVYYFKYTPDKIGDITIDILFNSTNFAAADAVLKITVSGIETNITIECDNTPQLNKSMTVTVTVNSTETLNGGNVTLFAGSVGIATESLVNGTCTFTYTPLTTGTQTLTAAYDGDETHSEAVASTNVTVWQATSMTVSPVKLAFGSKTVTITLKDQNGNAVANANIIVVFNKKTYNLTTDLNGQATLSTSGLVPKNYYVLTATFAGDDEYGKSTKTAKVVIVKATPKITAPKKAFKVKTKTKKYTVLLKVNGKVMKNANAYIKVNGKTFFAKTNSKGKATFKITNLKKRGKFIAAVTYKGNTKYNKVVVKTTITSK